MTPGPPGPSAWCPGRERPVPAQRVGGPHPGSCSPATTSVPSRPCLLDRGPEPAAFPGPQVAVPAAGHSPRPRRLLRTPSPRCVAVLGESPRPPRPAWPGPQRPGLLQTHLTEGLRAPSAVGKQQAGARRAEEVTAGRAGLGAAFVRGGSAGLTTTDTVPRPRAGVGWGAVRLPGLRGQKAPRRHHERGVGRLDAHLLPGPGHEMTRWHRHGFWGAESPRKRIWGTIIPLRPKQCQQQQLQLRGKVHSQEPLKRLSPPVASY